MVEIYHNSLRIAIHPRVRRRGYTTLKEHMPGKCRFFVELTPEKIIPRAEVIGDEVKALTEKILQEKKNTHQALRICLGIIDLSRRYDTERLNRACKRAYEFNLLSYKGVKNILEKGLDGVKEDMLSSKMPSLHKNIRGKRYFT